MPPDRRTLPLSSAWKAAPLFRAATPSEKHARHCRHRPAFALCGGNSAGNPLPVSKRCSLPGCKMGESVLTPGNALPGVIQVEPSRLLFVRPARGDRRKRCGDGVQWDTASPILPSLASALNVATDGNIYPTSALHVATISNETVTVCSGTLHLL